MERARVPLFCCTIKILWPHVPVTGRVRRPDEWSFSLGGKGRAVQRNRKMWKGCFIGIDIDQNCN